MPGVHKFAGSCYLVATATTLALFDGVLMGFQLAHHAVPIVTDSALLAERIFPDAYTQTSCSRERSPHDVRWELLTANLAHEDGLALVVPAQHDPLRTHFAEDPMPAELAQTLTTEDPHFVCLNGLRDREALESVLDVVLRHAETVGLA